MIHITEKQNCCGCEACAQVCPAQCISMTPDAEGFLYPSVDPERCIDCGSCERVCPMCTAAPAGESVRGAYAAFAADAEVREQSSSGGLFTLLARPVLDRGGPVFGAAFDPDRSVSHRAASSEEELDTLRGSKYLQSRTGDTFRQVKEALEQGTPVLFTGTACQCAGLHSFLGKDDEDLTTVDVLCHGVPSPAVWQAYVDEREAEYGALVRAVDFRRKTDGWNRFSLRMEFENGETYEQEFRKDPYMNLFLRNAILRPSCHACPFKAMERPTDITIGDAWGVENVFPEFSDDRGTSVVLVHSEKGARLLEQIRGGLVLKEGEADELLPPSADSRKSVEPHTNRETVFQIFRKNEPVTRLVKYTEPNVLQKVRRRLASITTHS